MKNTIWHTGIGLVLVLFATAIVTWAVHDLVSKELWHHFVLWGQQ